ncbi:MAG: 6-bladed beta-propeller [Bacteroidales bacterium]|nr:6-bladed beta-propeller [Bacteroidales bacterium]
MKPSIRFFSSITSFSIALLLIFSSCNNQDGNDAHSIEFALDNCKDMPLSTYASKIEYLPLETNRNSVMEAVSDVDTDGELLYTFCKYAPQKVYVFDMQGHFVNEIDKNGRGPGEYTSVLDFHLEKDLQKTYISLVTADARILSYNVDGDCVREVNLNLPKRSRITSSAYISNGRYAIVTASYVIDREKRQTIADSRKLTIIDTTGKLLYEKVLAISKPTHKEYYDRGHFAYSYNGNLRMSTGMESRDSLMVFNDQMEVISNHIFDFGQLRPDINENGAQIIHRWNIETDSFIKFQVSASWESMTKIYPENRGKRGHTTSMYLDKETNELFTIPYNYDFSLDGFTNDIDQGVPFVPIFVSGNKMYQPVQAEKFIEYAHMSNSPKMKEIAATLTEESNPVLIVATLK